MATSMDRDRSRTSGQQRYNQMLLSTTSSRDAARFSSARIKHTSVGSLPSGINQKGSDYDVMVEPTYFIVDESLLVYRDDLPVYVKIPVNGLPDNAPDILLSDDVYVHSDPVRDYDERIFDRSLSHLPRSKVGKIYVGNGISMDIVPQLRLSAIPRTARPFSTRDRSWPSVRIISMIINGEFHLTARPAPYDPDNDHDFCISFAKAEVILAKSMSASQLMCVHLLKTIRHTCIDEEGTILTSYHMKTTTLWYFEQAGIDIGASYHLSVVNILKRLDKYLGERFLPHYFVPKMNIFAGITDSDLLEVRRRLHRFIEFCLISSGPKLINPFANIQLAIDMYNTFSESAGSPRDILQADEYNYEQTTQRCSSHDGVDGANGCTYNAHVLSVLAKFKCSITSKFVDVIKKERSTKNEVANGWLITRRITDWSQLYKIQIINMVYAHYEPLEEFFCMGFRNTSDETGLTNKTELQIHKSEHIMNKWLTITDNIIGSLNTHMNSVTDQLLIGIWVAEIYPVLSPHIHCVTSSIRTDGVSHVSSDVQDIDKLFGLDRVTRKLLLSVIDAIMELSPNVLDSDAHQFVPTGDDDTLFTLQMLKLALNELFIPVECAIVSYLRSLTACASRDDIEDRLEQLLPPSGLEYQCHVAQWVVDDVLVDFKNWYGTIATFHGWMQFMTCLV